MNSRKYYLIDSNLLVSLKITKDRKPATVKEKMSLEKSISKYDALVFENVNLHAR